MQNYINFKGRKWFVYMFESPKDWDFAAPAALLKAAGGAITSLENEDLVYNQPKFEQKGVIVASNSKHNHAKICLTIKEIILKNKIYNIL